MLSGQSRQAAAVACGTSRSTAYRLLRRYHDGGWDGLRDRRPIARRCPHRLSLEAAEAQIVGLRRQTGWGPRSLSAVLGRPASTIWRVLKRCDCSRAEPLPRPPANRYEYAAVGELVHLDIKKLGRFWQIGKRVRKDGVRRSRHAGWSYAHVAVDDHSRHPQVELLRPTEQASDCVAFTRAVIRAYATNGTPIQRILTDNGNGYRSHAFRDLLTEHGIRHIRTRPYTPQTNGKAEAFIRILQREGLPLRLPLKPTPRPRAARLAALVQQPQTTRRHRRPPTHHPHLTRCEVLHLDRRASKGGISGGAVYSRLDASGRCRRRTGSLRLGSDGRR
jgi:transposase InsO family protein